MYVSGDGPAVVLLPEMPGISPDLIRLARWIRDAGLTVYLPSLFGVDGAIPTTEAGEQVMRRACVSAEFRAFAGGGTSPVVAWLRLLARQAHEECGGPGVGAVGLCFTGNFALTMTLEPAVIAPVVNHPSLPLDDPGGLEMSADDAAAVKERVGRDGLKVLGLSVRQRPVVHRTAIRGLPRPAGRRLRRSGALRRRSQRQPSAVLP